MSKTPRIGDLFTHAGRTYKVDSIPNYSQVCGYDQDPRANMPNSVKVEIREIELV